MTLEGPFPLSRIPDVVGGPGVYVLSSNGSNADYVGRSDSDLRSRLGASAAEGPYSHFWVRAENSARAAFLAECELYHRYDPPDNVVYPAVPAGTNWLCPVLGCEWE